jgi:hypothetical protein
MCIRAPFPWPRTKSSPALVYPSALGRLVGRQKIRKVPSQRETVNSRDRTNQNAMAAPAQAQVLPLLRWSRSASFLSASPRRLFSALRRPAAAARCEAGSKAMLKGMDYSELEVRALAQDTCGF